MAIVVDSSPLIHLARAGDFNLLRMVPGLLVPGAVIDEVIAEGRGASGEAELRTALGNWIDPVVVDSPWVVADLMRKTGLHRGEAEVLVTAARSSASGVLMDDQRAVAYARSVGIEVTRTPAIYNRAKRRGLIGSVREGLDRLRAGGFHLSDADYRTILEAANEA